MNVIVYVMDSVRADHLSCYGYHRDTTPTIDSIGSEGTVFEDCIAPSTWTRPVAASILTGLYPIVHGTRAVSDAFTPPVKPLPQQFRESGYATVGVESMPNIRAEVGFGQGFDEYINVYEQDWVKDERHEAPQFDDGTPLTRAEDLNRVFFEWLDETDDEPFFAFLWSNEPHLPYSPPSGYRQFTPEEYSGPISAQPEVMRQTQLVESADDYEQLLGLYDGELRYNDDIIGDLVAHLREEGVYDETLLVIAGDHGDAFDEHGHWGHGNQIPPYDEVVRVPLVVRVPGRDQRNRATEPASLVDIYPTVLDIAEGVDTPTGFDSIRGKSLGPNVEDSFSESNDDRWVFADNYRAHEYGAEDQWLVARSADWKYMEFDPGERQGSSYLQMATSLDVQTALNVLRSPREYVVRHLTPDTRGKLFDLRNDPEENHDVSSERYESYEECREVLHRWKRESEELREELDVRAEQAEMDETTMDQLEQLGYLD